MQGAAEKQPLFLQIRYQLPYFHLFVYCIPNIFFYLDLQKGFLMAYRKPALVLALCFSLRLSASIVDDAKKHSDFKVTKENAQGEGRLHLQMIDIIRKALSESVDCLKTAYRQKTDEIQKNDRFNSCDGTTDSCEKVAEALKAMNDQAKDLLQKLQLEYKSLKVVEGYYKKYQEKLEPFKTDHTEVVEYTHINSESIVPIKNS